jgi:hypothetical protein
LTSSGPGRLRVFISHSSRLRAESELRPGDTLNRHTFRKKYLADLIEITQARLRDSGVEVWVDRNQIHPGDDFDGKISFALYECDIGIILLDLDALDSPWVRKEATILMWRHAIGGVRVVPVLLGGLTTRDLRESELGTTVRLGDLTVLQPPTPKLNYAAAAFLANLIDLEVRRDARLPDVDSPSARWIQDFIHFTSGIPADRLWRVAERLGIDKDDWARATDRHAVVAGALLGADMSRAHQALVQLVDLLDEDRAKERTVHRALPLWVDLDAAKIVADSAELPPDRRLLAIATPAYRLGEHVIQRATFSAQEYTTLRLPDIVGEGTQDELLERYDATLRRLLHFFDDDSPEEISGELDSLGGRVFALIRCENLRPGTTTNVFNSLRKRFPGVTFVLLGRRENRVWQALQAPLVYRQNSNAWERSARRYVSRTASLIGEQIAVESDD